MVPNKAFLDCLGKHSIDFFAGVPDSLLKDFCAYISDNVDLRFNIIAANEGNAVALAAGYHLATGKVGVVYMQNSGLGNAINPLTSLADQDVYSIPLLLLIGWRAEPEIADEPQHVKMGAAMTKLLDSIGVPYRILSENFEQEIKDASDHFIKHSSPFAVIVKKNTFEKYELQNMRSKEPVSDLTREEAIKTIISMLSDDDVVVSTTGMASRELFEAREVEGRGHASDFLTVGSMGHSSSIALGIALNKTKNSVYCLDGDGSLIMHMGSLSVIGQMKPHNFKHIILNNFSHDSVGGQPTAALNLDIPPLAIASGYHDAFICKNKADLPGLVERLKKSKGPALLEIKLRKGHRKDLGRPKTRPIDNKTRFMDFIDKLK